ncbi:SLATT domain-containing protein [Bacillus sp. RO1]|uniref:SLATT domain-containing protein n=1 Tax=Bacillus sp. RO1 TaxID=2722703 RepID=UPI0014572CD9|nr:SLATT domain-containing protein [Bacillus sp. RO1]NLP52449.1 SLATT domain-containing protein [Bacillus sp. RO1]
MNDKMVKALINKIWITRKCRINTSERLILTNRIAQIFTNYYSIVILSISIWSLYSSSESNHLSFISVIASLFLLVGSIGVNSLNYKERIVNLRSCYIKLDGLLTDLEILQHQLSRLSNEESIKKFERISDNYNAILESVENHSSYDYLKFKITQKEYRHWFDYLKLYLLKFLFVILILLLTIIPFSPIIIIYGGI